MSGFLDINPQLHRCASPDTEPNLEPLSSYQTGLTYKGAGGGEGGYSTSAAAANLWGQANVCLFDFCLYPYMSPLLKDWLGLFSWLGSRWTKNRDSGADQRRQFRADDKTAKEYNLEGGATLHLVLALRGGL